MATPPLSFYIFLAGHTRRHPTWLLLWKLPFLGPFNSFVMSIAFLVMKRFSNLIVDKVLISCAFSIVLPTLQFIYLFSL